MKIKNEWKIARSFLRFPEQNYTFMEHLFHQDFLPSIPLWTADKLRQICQQFVESRYQELRQGFYRFELLSFTEENWGNICWKYAAISRAEFEIENLPHSRTDPGRNIDPIT